MQKENHRLMVEGNALYEIDLDCVRSKKEQEEKKKKASGKKQCAAGKTYSLKKDRGAVPRSFAEI